MQRYVIPAVVAGILIVALSIVQGSWSERWSKRPISQEQKVLAERMMRDIPNSFGDWESIDAPVNMREMEAAGAVGYFSRAYRKKGSTDPHDFVSVFLICGSPANMIIHTPDKCYVASGYDETSDQEKFPIKSGNQLSEFYTEKFNKGDSFESGAQNLRIFWSFSADGNWIAPTVPKIELMHYTAVAKVYARTDVKRDSQGRPEEGPAVAFLQQFMPVLNAALFPADATGDSKAAVGAAAAASAAATDSATPAPSGADPAAAAAPSGATNP